jgi:transcriptional regulator with XRE-family HTH domain
MSTVSDDEAKQRIAANLRRYRGELSLAEVARRADSFPTTIKEIEDGVRMPGVGLLTRIAAVFGATVDDFLKKPKSSQKSA